MGFENFSPENGNISIYSRLGAPSDVQIKGCETGDDSPQCSEHIKLFYDSPDRLRNGEEENTNPNYGDLSSSCMVGYDTCSRQWLCEHESCILEISVGNTNGNEGGGGGNNDNKNEGGALALAAIIWRTKHEMKGVPHRPLARHIHMYRS